MRTIFKKAVSVLLATAVVVSGAAVANGTQASAAKAKKVTAQVMFFANIKGASNPVWMYGDGSDAKVKTLRKTVTVKKGKKVNVTLTLKNTQKKAVSEAQVLVVDLLDILKSYKKVKISGLTVKADGKKKSAKLVQGKFEPKQKPYNYRISLYNIYGNNGDTSTQKNKAKNFGFKKNLTISFSFVAK